MPRELASRTFRHRWRSYRRVPATRLPRHWQRWLLDRGSLTARLVAASGGDFAVRLVRLGWARPTRSEARALAIPPRCRALIREVHLLGRGQVWVRARTVIPASSLKGPNRRLLRLGNRSLGSFLFSHPTLERGPMETCRIESEGGTAWARRSVFRLNGHPLLVAELFLPPLAETPPPGDRLSRLGRRRRRG